MRLPYVQIAMEVLEQLAPEVAVELGHDEDAILGKLVRLVKWGLGRCPDSSPPSENSLVPGQHAAKHIARAAMWMGDPDEFVNAICASRFSMLERVDGGVRIRGLDRYDAAWRKNRSGTVPKPALNRDGTGTEPAPQTQTQTQIKETTPQPPSGELAGVEPEPIPQKPKEPEPEVDEVAAYYLEAMRAQKKKAKVTDRGKGLIRARLAEGLSVAELKTAIDGLTWSDHHMKGGFTGIKYALRSLDQVQMMSERVPPEARDHELQEAAG